MAVLKIGYLFSELKLVIVESEMLRFSRQNFVKLLTGKIHRHTQVKNLFKVDFCEIANWQNRHTQVILSL